MLHLFLNSPLLKTHYEVLGVVQTSSFKEIKDAFVKRSKQVRR